MFKIRLCLIIIGILMSGCSSKSEATESAFTLIGGRESTAGDFPASVYVTMASGGQCSATIVGSSSLLLAGHCVAGGPVLSFVVMGNKFSAICTRSLILGHDLALCKINKEIKGVAFENVNLDANLLKIGTEVLLTGYGCTESNNGRGSGGNDGIFRIGEALITKLASPFDLETNSGAAVCFGDSGGSAYFYTDASKTKRVVISTNSRGDIAAMSLITSTSSKPSIDFMKTWTVANTEKICGFNNEAKGCRDADSQNRGACEMAYENLNVCLKKDTLQY